MAMRKLSPSRSSRRNYWNNLRLLKNNARVLNPLVVTYYVTTQCNLNCQYCEEFGARLNSNGNHANLESAKKILGVIRSGTDNLVLTGGEPLTHPNIEELVTFAKTTLGFTRLTMLTNGYLLGEHEALLPHLDRLVVSIDSVDPNEWHKLIGAPLAAAKKILANIQSYAARQDEFGYRMILNTVMTPETLDEVEPLLQFAQKQDLLISFSPQAIHNWPSYDLVVSEKYRSLLKLLLKMKEQGAPIAGSRAYFTTLLTLTPYQCYPTLAPRVMPNGDLIYPCRPIEKEGDSRGGRYNLMDADSWEQAISALSDDYGQPPRACTSCFQQCYAEPSLMQSRPIAYLGEMLRYSPSRKANLATYPPG